MTSDGLNKAQNVKRYLTYAKYRKPILSASDYTKAYQRGSLMRRSISAPHAEPNWSARAVKTENKVQHHEESSFPMILFLLGIGVVKPDLRSGDRRGL